MADNSNDFIDFSGVRSAAEQGVLNDKDFPILQGLSPISMRILNTASRVMHVSKGVEMLHEGDAPHDLYFIKSGKMAIARQSGSQLKVLATLGSGQIYGEFGVLRKKSRYASAYTAEASTIVRVELAAVQQVLSADSNFRQRLNELLTHRMLDSFFFAHPVFNGLPANVRVQISKELPISFFERNTRMFTQGDKLGPFYLILSGEVEVRYLNDKKEEFLLEIRRDNDMLGEPIDESGRRPYSAVTASDLDALVLDGKAMQLLKSKHPETYMKLQKYVIKRTEHTAMRLKEARS